MSGSQSLERGLAILELLDGSPKPVGVRDIARRLEINPTIIQRLINTLLEHNYVRQNEESRRYSIGYRALTLGAQLARTDNLIVTAHSELQRVATSHKLNGYLGTLRGNRAVYLLSVESDGPVAIRNQPGEVTYLHTTAMGKVLLASLTDEQASAILGEAPLPAVTAATKTDPAEILAELAEIRAKGFCTIVDENIMGVVSVGAPIRGVNGEIRAAVSLAYARHFQPDLAPIDAALIVMEVASRISEQLGFSDG